MDAADVRLDDHLRLIRSLEALVETDVEHLSQVLDKEEQVLKLMIDEHHVVVEDGEGILNGLLRLFHLKLRQLEAWHCKFFEDHIGVLLRDQLV